MTISWPKKTLLACQIIILEILHVFSVVCHTIFTLKPARNPLFFQALISAAILPKTPIPVFIAFNDTTSGTIKWTLQGLLVVQGIQISLS